MLSLINVTKKYGDKTALDNITVDFENGVYGLIAPNGAGKTTLMKLLATLHFPTSGEILWNGQNIVKLDEDYRDIIGYLPQKFGYYNDYSPTSYLLYLSALKGLEYKFSKKRTAELLDMVSLTDVAHKKMKKFSGGMVQRVGIAAALLNDPQILLLDEPTAGLDPKERVRFRNILANLSKEKIVILSTHIVSDVESIANWIIMLNNNKIFCNDTVEQVCNLISGKVFEAVMPNTELEQFRNTHLVLSERFEGSNAFIRFISDDSCTYTPKTACLEDVFLYVFRDKVGDGNSVT